VVRRERGQNGRECTAGWKVGVRVSRRQEDREYVKVNMGDERECCRQGDWHAGTEIGMVRSMVNTGGEIEKDRAMEKGREID
jgi:hypothetical protein